MKQKLAMVAALTAAGLVLGGCTHTIRVMNTGDADLEISEKDNPEGWVYTLPPGSSMRVRVRTGEEIDLPGVRLRVE